MKKAGWYLVIVFALVCAVFVTWAVAGDNYSVSSGSQATTYRSQGGQAPAPKPVAKPSPTISQAPASTPQPQTKTIMVPTWPVQVPVRVPANTPERPENPHAGENVGAAQGLGGR